MGLFIWWLCNRKVKSLCIGKRYGLVESEVAPHRGIGGSQTSSYRGDLQSAYKLRLQTKLIPYLLDVQSKFHG